MCENTWSGSGRYICLTHGKRQYHENGSNAVYIGMSGLRMIGVAEDCHLVAVRAEINVFRELFKEWVNGFEKGEFEDEWGLFK